MKCMRIFSAAMATLALSSSIAFADNPANTPGITGTMNIDFTTRTPSGQESDGSPKKGAQDKYSLDLIVNGTNGFQGQILRQPRITQLKIRTVQQPRYDYSINLFVALKDGSKPNVGAWVGPMNIDEKSGAFILDADGDRALRLNITHGSGFTDNFGGRFYGKPADKSALSWETLKRTINGKVVEKKFQADPIRFENLKLGKGPNPLMYPSATVNGNLDYDRETSNYYAKDLKFDYAGPTGNKEDVVSGTIKWVEDPNRAQNGIGHYEFNLRFNEDKVVKPTQVTDEAQFGGKSDDDLFFAVDKSIPALTGRIDYVDSGLNGKDDALPTGSKVNYTVTSNNLTPQQVMNFAKMWLVIVGPSNDE